MMHDRVADQRHFQDFVACDPGLARGFADQRVHRLAHHARQLLVAARVHHHVGDAAHQIFAEADLRVHRPDRGDDLAAHEIGQMGGDGGRADIDRDAEGALGEARHDGDDVAALAQRDGDLPLPRAQRLLKASERREIGVRFVEIPLLVQSLLQATKIARTARACPARGPRRNRGGRPGRSRSDASPRACGRPADEPDFRAARRRRDRRKSWPGIQAAGRRRTRPRFEA